MSKVTKNKYKHFNKKLSKSGLDINLKGFLCSCNNREKECVREAYNLLNKYTDIVYPPQTDSVEKNDSELSIEDELKREIVGLKTVKRFQQLESGAKNFLFIKTDLENPVKIAHTMLLDIKNNCEQQTKFLIRLVPIEVTCKAYIKDIVNAFLPLAEKYFKQNPTSYSIVYNHRNNNSLNKEEVIKAVAEVVNQTNSNNTVDLKAANVSIVIEVIKGIALIGVVPEFLMLKKYNLLSVTDKNIDVSSENVPTIEKDKNNE